MSKQTESTLGERMQGSVRDCDVSLAIHVLRGNTTLEKLKADKRWTELETDWAFVERYIADHRHEYPDYKG